MKELTDKHRVVVRFNSTGDEVELGLYSAQGRLALPDGRIVRDEDGTDMLKYHRGEYGFEILEVIDPPFEPKEGMTIFNPENRAEHLTYLPNNTDETAFPWSGIADWEWDRYTTAHAEELVTKYGWQVLGA